MSSHVPNAGEQHREERSKCCCIEYGHDCLRLPVAPPRRNGELKTCDCDSHAGKDKHGNEDWQPAKAALARKSPQAGDGSDESETELISGQRLTSWLMARMF